MSECAVVVAGRNVADRLDDVRTAAISTDDRILALSECETLMRRLEHFQIELIAGLDREGAFTERGYRSAAHAVADLLGWDTAQARRRLRIARTAWWCRSCSAGTGNPWMWAGRSARCPTASAARCSPATAAAHFPGVIVPRRGATSTTFTNGDTSASPRSTAA